MTASISFVIWEVAILKSAGGRDSSFKGNLGGDGLISSVLASPFSVTSCLLLVTKISPRMPWSEKAAVTGA